MNVQEYVVYKGESFVFIGTIQEYAQHRGVLPETVRYLYNASLSEEVSEGGES